MLFLCLLVLLLYFIWLCLVCMVCPVWFFFVKFVLFLPFILFFVFSFHLPKTNLCNQCHIILSLFPCFIFLCTEFLASISLLPPPSLFLSNYLFLYCTIFSLSLSHFPLNDLAVVKLIICVVFITSNNVFNQFVFLYRYLFLTPTIIVLVDCRISKEHCPPYYCYLFPCVVAYFFNHIFGFVVAVCGSVWCSCCFLVILESLVCPYGLFYVLGHNQCLWFCFYCCFDCFWSC